MALALSMPIQQDLGLVLVVSTICSSLFLARILRLAVRGAGNARDRERSRSPWPPRASPGSLDPRFKLFVSLRLDAALVHDLHLARH